MQCDHFFHKLHLQCYPIVENIKVCSAITGTEGTAAVE